MKFAQRFYLENFVIASLRTFPYPDWEKSFVNKPQAILIYLI